MFGLTLGLFDLSRQRLGKTQAPERELGDWRRRLQYEYVQTIDLAPTFGSSAGKEAQVVPIAMQMLWSLEFDPVIVNDRLHILSASGNATVRTAAEKWKRMLDASNKEAGASESRPEPTQ